MRLFCINISAIQTTKLFRHAMLLVGLFYIIGEFHDATFEEKKETEKEEVITKEAIETTQSVLIRLIPDALKKQLPFRLKISLGFSRIIIVQRKLFLLYCQFITYQ